jgi:hypothetical protein
MSNLLDLIRKERLRRSGGDEDFLVVFLRCFSENIIPRSRVGNTMLEQAPGEAFEDFKTRAIATAKAAGANYVVINVPEPLSL